MDPSSGVAEAISALGNMSEEEFRDSMNRLRSSETEEGDLHDLLSESADDLVNLMNSGKEDDRNFAMDDSVIKPQIEFATPSGSFNELEKPDNVDWSFVDKFVWGQGTRTPVSAPQMEIRFFLREAARRAKEAESLIESTSALGNMCLDQRSRQLFESAKSEITMAVASMNRASDNVLQAKLSSDNVLQAKSHPPDPGMMRRRRDTKRKKRQVINPVLEADPVAVVNPPDMVGPSLRRSSRVATVAEATPLRRSSRRLLHIPDDDDDSIGKEL